MTSLFLDAHCFATVYVQCKSIVSIYLCMRLHASVCMHPTIGYLRHFVSLQLSLRLLVLLVVFSPVFLSTIVSFHKRLPSVFQRQRGFFMLLRVFFLIHQTCLKKIREKRRDEKRRRRLLKPHRTFRKAGGVFHLCRVFLSFSFETP